MPTTTTTSTTLPTTPPTTPTPTTPTPPIDNVNTLSTSAVDTTAISTASTSTLTETTIGANQTLQDSHASAITMPAAQSPNDNYALIGGIIGGVVALILLGALIACLVVRSRRQPKDSDNGDSALQVKANAPLESNYGRLPPSAPTTTYDIVQAPPHDYEQASSSMQF
jgi:hypothetical protein